MKHDLKNPCKNCPFRTDKSAIQFSCRERAEEIEEGAYRYGFPCHKSAKYVDDDETPDGESGGYYATEESQHCVGYIIMQINDSGGGFPWPGIGNDEDLLDRLESRVNLKAPVFDSVEDFLKANERNKHHDDTNF